MKTSTAAVLMSKSLAAAGVFPLASVSSMTSSPGNCSLCYRGVSLLLSAPKRAMPSDKCVIQFLIMRVHMKCSTVPTSCGFWGY